MPSYTVKILIQIDGVFSFDLFGPEFSSISPWEHRRRKAYKEVNKEKKKLSNNESIRSSIQK